MPLPFLFPITAALARGKCARFCCAAESCGADYLVTTEKDGVKLGQYRERLGNIHTAALEMWVADPGPLQNALEKLLEKPD